MLGRFLDFSEHSHVVRFVTFYSPCAYPFKARFYGWRGWNSLGQILNEFFCVLNDLPKLQLVYTLFKVFLEYHGSEEAFTVADYTVTQMQSHLCWSSHSGFPKWIFANAPRKWWQEYGSKMSFKTFVIRHPQHRCWMLKALFIHFLWAFLCRFGNSTEAPFLSVHFDPRTPPYFLQCPIMHYLARCPSPCWLHSDNKRG